MEVLFLLIAALFFFWLFKGSFGDPRPGSTITGKAYVTDGDGIRVSGYTIRFTGLDAPEWGQVAKHQHGYWFNQGKRVKIALVQAIGGKYVQVAVEGYDKYGRVLGSVTCEGKDVWGMAGPKRIRNLRIRRQIQRPRRRGPVGKAGAVGSCRIP